MVLKKLGPKVKELMVSSPGPLVQKARLQQEVCSTQMEWKEHQIGHKETWAGASQETWSVPQSLSFLLSKMGVTSPILSTWKGWLPGSHEATVQKRPGRGQSFPNGEQGSPVQEKGLRIRKGSEG